MYIQLSVEGIARFLFETAIVLTLRFRKFWYGAPPDWKITKVIVECEDEPRPDKDFMEITSVFDPEQWKAEPDKLGWKHWKMEVRYMFRKKKYRAAARENESCPFPPCPTQEAEKHGKLRTPNGMLLSAQLHNTDGGDPLCITKRLAKYEGVLGDFGGRGFRCHDLFPFDDNEYSADHFTKLVIHRLSFSRGTTTQSVVNFFLGTQ